MKIKNITDVFFDLDHTLWDFDKNSALTFEKIFEINKIEVEINKFLDIYLPINLNYWKLYREDKVSKETLRFGRLNDAFLALEVEVNREVIDKLSDDYIEHLSSFNHLFDNTFEILDYLNENYSLHIITNGFDEVQHKKMAKSNILHYFNTVTNSEMVGVKKPNPKIFNYALDLANTKPETSIMIGDSFEADILGAKNIGMDVIFFDINNITLDDDTKQVDNLLSLRHYL
ncbi:YjjG family noncanonical pyrimidine nucleotidase [Algibacter lectus]|uniref:5'-nucleotidase YjjG n=1 Tax=Algibacter lectus TaxID=221126 RepID=A0A090VFF8_9FLAO|nr:YjjG family noncanonical pyrimidine nucleotidase [Algibacter lectus]MDO7138098.1 YjjG family noncanonical pyrimidine nucleotidase [Algibacter lectus]MWW26413.1 noncanonical pyrimidine nucleotidase, YjjG family [Algibacter lectus]TDY60003.1 putative hydrolase of the HAD superfamily [Algibacter lectus]SFD40679.1 putative hydrolase of the HAD superfamily [Algibacter lectus]GAL63471.1 5'-nucleotidase YjjG [Algibacter lectus]